MSCGTPASSGFQPDFFNNVAAIAAVLMFTKVVTHRSRTTERRRALDYLHGLAVLGSFIAIGASLWTTEACSLEDWPDWVAWTGLALTGGALLLDIAVEDVGFRSLSQWMAKPETSTNDVSPPARWRRFRPRV